MDQLIADLERCGALLSGVGADFWADRMTSAARRLRAGQREATREVATWFGGMGSLNDLVISPVNGHRIAADQEAAANAELRRLTDAIYSLVQRITD